VTTPAGWYPDPDGSRGQRYWTGESWSDHRAPAAAAPAAAKSGLDPKVIIGLAAGVVLLLVVGVAAVVLTLRIDTDDDEITFALTPADSGATAAPTTETESVPDTETADPEEPQAAGVGEEVTDGNFSFVINGVERAAAVADPDIPELHKAAAGEYVIVKMTVTNVGTEPQTFFASFNTLSDGASVYQSDDEALVYLDNTLVDLNPGDTVETAAVFDVPVGTDLESIELHDGPFSDGVTVGL
jgi:hypothetical protein